MPTQRELKKIKKLQDIEIHKARDFHFSVNLMRLDDEEEEEKKKK